MTRSNDTDICALSNLSILADSSLQGFVPAKMYSHCHLPPIHFRADYNHCSMFWWEANVTAHAYWHSGHVPDMRTFFTECHFYCFVTIRDESRWQSHVCDRASQYLLFTELSGETEAVLSCVLDTEVIRGAQVVSCQRQVRPGSCSLAADLQGLPQWDHKDSIVSHPNICWSSRSWSTRIYYESTEWNITRAHSLCV